MAEAEPRLWGIHAGKTGDANTHFLKNNVIAIGWADMGDLGQLAADREAFKARVVECFPGRKPAAIPIIAGQMFRFVHEMKVGDFVAYPSKQDGQVHIGSVEGPYRYDPSLEPGYPNLRPVKWLRSIPRKDFSLGALHEIGSALSFFQVKTYAEEFLAALKGTTAPTGSEIDETVPLVAQEIETNTRDFVLKRLAQELKGKPLEYFIAHLLEAMGYRTRVSPEGTDGGIDIIAHRDELGFEPPIIKVQVKSTGGNVGDPEVSALYGKVEAGEFGLLVTLGAFSKQAESFARGKSNLRLIHGEELVDLVFQHYEKFDARYKGLIPLKRVYVPEPLEESEE